MTVGWIARARAGSITAMILLAIGAAPVVAQADAWGASSSLVPATNLRGAECVVSDSSPAVVPFVATPPTVLPHPSGVDVVWLPGLNSKTCKAILTRGNTHIASALASDINHAPVIPKNETFHETFHCPTDDDTSARLYFLYPHGTKEQIDADLSGCALITGWGTNRSSTAQFRKDMRALAPSAWRVYIAPNADPSA